MFANVEQAEQELDQMENTHNDKTSMCVSGEQGVLALSAQCVYAITNETHCNPRHHSVNVLHNAGRTFVK